MFRKIFNENNSDFYPFQVRNSENCHIVASYPRVSVSVTVQATLTEGKSNQIPFYPPTPSLESVFRCHFDISSPELYVYDVIWYINGNKVKRMNNVLYGNINTTVLRNSDWIEDYQMNMEVHEKSNILLTTRSNFGMNKLH